MNEDDNEFFVLVLGVLAAIVLVVCWWFISGGTSAAPLATISDTRTVADDETEDEEPPQSGDAAENNDGSDSASTADEDRADDAGTPAEADEGQSAGDLGDDDQGAEQGADEQRVELPRAATVFDAIAENSDLSVISGLLRDTELDRVLASGGPFTVFAPTDDAINAAASSDTTLEVLTADQEGVLTYHVVRGEYTADDLLDLAHGARSTELISLQGETLSLTIESGTVVINGSTSVSPIVQAAENGYVHTLDNVLVPPLGALNALVELDPILFATGSAEIQPESFATLDSFIEILDASTVDVRIEGHTDSSGDPVLNQNLSQDRAQSIVNYLVANGIDEPRLTAQGFGADQPVANNGTEEGRALNRRIEFALG